jgi:hypothetical protein
MAPIREKGSRKEAADDSVKKTMLTIVWNPSGFHFINVLSN